MLRIKSPFCPFCRLCLAWIEWYPRFLELSRLRQLNCLVNALFILQIQLASNSECDNYVGTQLFVCVGGRGLASFVDSRYTLYSLLILLSSTKWLTSESCIYLGPTSIVYFVFLGLSNGTHQQDIFLFSLHLGRSPWLAVPGPLLWLPLKRCNIFLASI